jgi:hypothetical protein
VSVSESITCPKCYAEIPLTEAISHQVEERLRLQFEAAARVVAEEHAQALAAKETELQSGLAEARAEVEATAVSRAKESVRVQLGDLSAQVEEQATRLAAAEENELVLLKEKRELQQKQQALELEVARQLDEERVKLVVGTTERLEEKHRLEMREKDLTLEQMGKRIEDLRAAAEPKRSGLQGEVLERELEDVLREWFPADAIEPVKAGARGADVLQRVRSPRGLDCGTLLWESKNAKTWSNGWAEKLRSDRQAEKADMAIIVSSVLPDGVQRIGMHDGVWVCDFASATTLATALRLALVEINQARSVDTNRTQTMDALYDYLCGKDFQHRVESIVNAAVTMNHDLDTEKRATEKLWAKRAKQIEHLTRNSAGMYGELQAIVGAALQPVPILELPSGASDDGPLALAS